MEDVTSKLKNFEKSKNENMFPNSVTLFANILAFLLKISFYRPFLKWLFVSTRSKACCALATNGFIKRITHRASGCKQTRASGMHSDSVCLTGKEQRPRFLVRVRVACHEDQPEHPPHPCVG